jgi:hypothetical protein
MPASAIDRLSALGHRPDPTGGLNFVPFNRTNSHLEKISRQARRLRGSSNGSFQNALGLQGRGDALEALTTRLGIIPVIAVPPTASLSVTMEGYPSDRNIATAAETVTFTGGTAPQVFTAPNSPAVAVAFTAGGNAQAVTAVDSVDAAAKGRALVDVLP